VSYLVGLTTSMWVGMFVLTVLIGIVFYGSGAGADQRRRPAVTVAVSQRTPIYFSRSSPVSGAVQQ